jgi:hypothetical protein
MIVNLEKVDLIKYKKVSTCDVYIVTVTINDIKKRATEMLAKITDQNWMSSLGVCDRVSYSARAKKTIKKLTSDIIKQVDSKINEEFGEYLVSTSAQEAVCTDLRHDSIPLAELWKEKMSGNPGFDFHTVSPKSIICFGEAKYSSVRTPHMIAVNQIISFIDEEKDKMELTDLQKFISAGAMKNALDNKKGYIAAFSLNGKRYNQIFGTVLKSMEVERLLAFNELLLVGIEIC